MPQNMQLPEKITQDSTKSTSFNTLTSTLGNNIKQYADNGLNAARDTWTIQYAVLTETEMTTVVTMLMAVGGGKDYINWTPLGETTSKKWVVVNGEHSVTVIGGDQYRVSFTIEEEH